jgi:hypothetical protein
MVGYGQSGYGDVGYTTSASFTVKRSGQNLPDQFAGQDDASKPSANEVFYFDFDGPSASTNFLGGLTLGNRIETHLGPGDSGGPSFILDGSAFKVAGINTFGFRFTPRSPRPSLFGSGGGGIIVAPYADWISSIMNDSSGTPTSGGGGGPGSQGGGSSNPGKEAMPSQMQAALADTLDLLQASLVAAPLRTGSSFAVAGAAQTPAQFLPEAPRPTPVVSAPPANRTVVAPPVLLGSSSRLDPETGKLVTAEEEKAAPPNEQGEQGGEHRPAPKDHRPREGQPDQPVPPSDREPPTGREPAALLDSAEMAEATAEFWQGAGEASLAEDYHPAVPVYPGPAIEPAAEAAVLGLALGGYWARRAEQPAARARRWFRA